MLRWIIMTILALVGVPTIGHDLKSTASEEAGVTSTSFRFITLTFFVLIFSLSGCSSPDEPEPDTFGTNWRLMDTWPSYDIYSLAWGDTLLVAVGNQGVFHVSTDGLQWQHLPPDIPENMNDVTWTGNQFVAVGSGGTVATSPDGVTWTVQDTPISSPLYSVAGNDQHILGSGASDVLVSSSNGTDWFLHLSGISLQFEDILIDDTLWLACGDSGMTATSPDGYVWTRRPTPLSQYCRLLALTKADNEYFAIGTTEPFGGVGYSYVFSSPDGLTWTQTASIDNAVLRDIAWTGSELVAVGMVSTSFGDAPESAVLTSSNGVTWEVQSCDGPVELTCVVAGHGSTVTAGLDGYLIAGSSPGNMEIIRSGAHITGLKYDGHQFIGITRLGTVVTSSNGSSWTERHSHAAVHFAALAYSGGKYVAAGGLAGEARSLFYSPDGADWTRVWDPIGGDIFDLIRGGGRFVGVGEYGHVFLSDDGQTWDRVVAAGAIDLRTVAWSGTKYLALGDSTAHLSGNGSSWSNHAIEAPFGSHIKQVIWADGQWRGVGYRVPDFGDPFYCFFSSVDGYNWTARKLNWGDFISPTDLSYNGERYFLYGMNGTLLTSVDGEEWKRLETGTDSEINGMGISRNRLVLGGANRTILRAER